MGKHTQQGLFPRCLGQVFPAFPGADRSTRICRAACKPGVVLIVRMCVWSAGTRKELRSSSKVAGKRNAPSGQNWPGWPKLAAPWGSEDDEILKAVFVVLVLFLFIGCFTFRRCP